MKYGFCTGFATTPLFTISPILDERVISAGFYPEYPVMAIESLSSAEFEALCRRVGDIKTPTSCNFFPGSIALLGKNRNTEKIVSYLDRVLPRLKVLGVEAVVLGSGKARMKGSLSHCEAERELSSLLENFILPMNKQYGMKVLIEPLSFGECDWLNTAKESAGFVKGVSDSTLSLMVDLFHMRANGEKAEDLYELFPLIDHVHIAGEGRALYTDSFDSYVTKALGILKECGYSKNISFETVDASPVDIKKARALIGSKF
jgi:Xylose isomerase-like TIM barrel.